MKRKMHPQILALFAPLDTEERRLNLRVRTAPRLCRFAHLGQIIDPSSI
jgi:hypothetical protein